MLTKVSVRHKALCLRQEGEREWKTQNKQGMAPTLVLLHFGRNTNKRGNKGQLSEGANGLGPHDDHPSQGHPGPSDYPEDLEFTVDPSSPTHHLHTPGVPHTSTQLTNYTATDSV